MSDDDLPEKIDAGARRDSSFVERLRASTPARVALGRVGDAPPWRATLEFQGDHARARDAVHRAADFERLAQDLAEFSPLRVRSRAPDRAVYLRRPDLGRRLGDESRELWSAALARQLASGDNEPRDDSCVDLLVVLGDGLAADAVMHHATELVRELRRRLDDWSWAPLVLAEQARVALGDELGELARARFVVVLLGERPGLSVADSLGIYVTHDPRTGRTDAERNCISNVHDRGLTPTRAAFELAHLLRVAREKRLTGVALQVETRDLVERLP